MDTLTPLQRSERMSRVRGKNSRPEMIVRRLAHALGYRHRLHRKDLPGCPDLVFPGRRKVLFVHGCFWHRHDGCKLARLPKSRLDFWTKKLEGNKERDRRDQVALSSAGWDILIIWECELRNREALSERLVAFLEGKGSDAGS